MAESLVEMIKNRQYLLGFQKKLLLEDLEEKLLSEDLGDIPTDDKWKEKIIDKVFYRLFGKGWDELTGPEMQAINDAWKRH